MARAFTILFVDDDLGRFEDLVGDYFSRTRPEWRCVFADSLEFAREALLSEAPDAVVLDLELSPGGREGLDILYQVRRHSKAVPVIVLTDIRDAQVLRDAFLREKVSEDLTVEDLDPEALLFKEEILASQRLDVLEWKIARALHKYGRVANDTGILITHGTDTMAWGLCYLRYALKGLRANVAVTGSQVPLEGYFSSSDALGNLKTALYLLNRLRPAHLFAVFNNGQRVFSGRLTKYRKWDTDAFEGRLAASASPDGITSVRKDWVFIPYQDQRLQDLHLIRTGGTIESQRSSHDFGALKPTGDFVWKYLNDPLSGFFVNPHRHDLFSLDSSNLSYEHWAMIALEVQRIGVATADTRFDLSVKPVFANPVFTTADYAAQFGACGKGAIFCGYGGGNANILDASGHSVLPALKDAVDSGKFVAVTSQVPLEPYDADYETGLTLLEAGGVPCGDLPLADAQLKLSYILGHEEELQAVAAEAGLSPRFLATAAFLSGVSMRRAYSMEIFCRLLEKRGTPLRVHPDDPFVARPFEAGLRAVVQACRDAK
jgi:L-asparaginase/Glu-tRNA(Gln) amidotransferase subunit D